MIERSFSFCLTSGFGGSTFGNIKKERSFYIRNDEPKEKET